MDAIKKKNILIVAMLFALCFMATAYAALSQQLEINGTATIANSEWNVRITNIEAIATSGSAENGSVSNTGTIATISPVFYSVGDSVTYSVTVENRGSIDATLDSIVTAVSTDDGTINPSIVYQYEGIKANDVLTSGDSVTFTITVSYNSSSTTATTIENESTQVVTLTGTLNYQQYEK